jgi:hypothetical protein
MSHVLVPTQGAYFQTHIPNQRSPLEKSPCAQIALRCQAPIICVNHDSPIERASNAALQHNAQKLRSKNPVKTLSYD